MKDSVAKSAVRGRVGAVLLASVSAALTAYGVGAEEQDLLLQAGSIVSGLGAAALAGLSKLRERIKK